MQIENDSYTWTLIHEMAKMDRSVNRSYSSEIQSSPELVKSEMIEASKRFMEIINGVLESAFDTLPADSQDIMTLTDCFFVWNIVHIFYIDKNNSIAEDFATLIGKTLPQPQKLEEFLIRADFGGFLTKLKSYGARYVNEDPTERQRLLGLFNNIQELVIGRNNFFRPIDLYETKAVQRNTFKKSFESQKERFKDILNNLQSLSNKEDSGIKSLINSVKLLSGDTEYIKQEYSTSDMQLFTCYLLFIDPLLDGNLVRQFMGSLSTNKSTRLLLHSKSTNAHRKSQSNDDSISSVNDLEDGELPDDEILGKCSDLIKNIILKCFLNPDNAYAVAETLLINTPKWLGFHIIKLLIIIRTIKHGTVDSDSSSNYYGTLLDGYLKYLITESCTFKVFKAYYIQMYNFNDNIKFDYLLRIVFININDNEMLVYLNRQNCSYIVEKAVNHFISTEKFQELQPNTLISLLSYTNEESVAEQLFEILFNVKLTALRSKDDEEYRVELERLINHSIECLEFSPTNNSWRINVLRDLLGYKLRVANRENLGINFLTQMFGDLDKVIELDLILSLELIDCINEGLNSIQSSLSVSSFEFETINSYLRNLQICRIKQKIFKNNTRYANLLAEAENTAMMVGYGG